MPETLREAPQPRNQPIMSLNPNVKVASINPPPPPRICSGAGSKQTLKGVGVVIVKGGGWAGSGLLSVSSQRGLLMEESPRPASPRSPDFINVTLYYYDFEASWGVALADLFGSCFLEGF